MSAERDNIAVSVLPSAPSAQPSTQALCPSTPVAALVWVLGTVVGTGIFAAASAAVVEYGASLAWGIVISTVLFVGLVPVQRNERVDWFRATCRATLVASSGMAGIVSSANLHAWWTQDANTQPTTVAQFKYLIAAWAGGACLWPLWGTMLWLSVVSALWMRERCLCSLTSPLRFIVAQAQAQQGQQGQAQEQQPQVELVVRGGSEAEEVAAALSAHGRFSVSRRV
jgi:hypothetical protein